MEIGNIVCHVASPPVHCNATFPASQRRSGGAFFVHQRLQPDRLRAVQRGLGALPSNKHDAIRDRVALLADMRGMPFAGKLLVCAIASAYLAVMPLFLFRHAHFSCGLFSFLSYAIYQRNSNQRQVSKKNPQKIFFTKLDKTLFFYQYKMRGVSRATHHYLLKRSRGGDPI